VPFGSTSLALARPCADRLVLPFASEESAQYVFEVFPLGIAKGILYTLLLSWVEVVATGRPQFLVGVLEVTSTRTGVVGVVRVRVEARVYASC
jgi:hypothetical protein